MSTRKAADTSALFGQKVAERWYGAADQLQSNLRRRSRIAAKRGRMCATLKRNRIERPNYSWPRYLDHYRAAQRRNPR